MMDEGVIKYYCDWQQTDAFQPPPQDAAEVTELLVWRDKLHQLGLVHVYPDGIGFGNLSVRIAGQGFLITGTQTSHVVHLGLEHCALVDDYSLEANRVSCRGPVKASSEALTHAAFYELDAEIRAVVHVHNHQLWQSSLDHLPTTQKQIPYGSVQMALEVRRLWENGSLLRERALVMAGHEDGVITCGHSVAQAATRMIELYSPFEGN